MTEAQRPFLVMIVRALDPADIHRVSAALGWLGLGDAREARAELAQITPEQQNHPDVLEVQWCLCVKDERWDDALRIARSILTEVPERSSSWLHHAYALRRVPNGGVKQAWKAGKHATRSSIRRVGTASFPILGYSIGKGFSPRPLFLQRYQDSDAFSIT